VSLWRRFRALPTAVQAVLVVAVLVMAGALVDRAADDDVRADRPATTTTTTTTARDRATTTAPTAGEPTSPGPAPAPTAPPPIVQPVPAGDDAEVVRVVDGDTLVIRVSGREERVRLIGIDTPETVHPQRAVECFGREASAHTSRLIGPGTAIRLVHDVERTDRFGRTLAYLYRLDDGLFVNLALVLDGYAQVATFPPNVAHAEDFLAAQREARDAGRGLWSACADEDDVAAPPPEGTGTCTARMSDPAPAQRSATVVQVSSDLPGQTVAATAHYRTTRRTNTGTTGPDGAALIEFRIGGATPGVTVIVEVDVGDGAATCETSFPPS
jgi:micrococcal nuclease